MYKQLNRISMKQFLNELNEHMGRLAYVVEGPDGATLRVFPSPDYDFIPQVSIEHLMRFCRVECLHFWIDFHVGCIIVYKPEDLIKTTASK
jgi:hypothetical protein